ncbi:MAG: hypothetical protein Q7N95_17880 [Alphaproteobacteria bacterium]|nr:hypothetical protein [Alphaproteobacteria bacterium]
MNNGIVSLLRRIGPALTTELIAEMAKDGISATAARQRIARSRGEVTRLAGLRFTQNARFVYLPDQFGDQAYWAAIERVFRSHGASYWGAVVGMKARGGLYPRKFFASVCGCPNSRKRQLSPNRVFERLSAINLLEEIEDNSTGDKLVKFRPHVYGADPLATVRARLIAEDVILHGMKEWCRRVGFGSFDLVRIRGDENPPVVSSITWDMSAPSYARPLVRAVGAGLKPGFIVCDVNLRGALDEDDVKLFVRKHDMASGPSEVAPIMPFLLADGFTSAGFNFARQKGVLATTVSHLFGEDVATALRDLIGLLTDMGAKVSVDPEHIERVLTSLTRIEGAANNLRGALFELVVGNLVKDVEGGCMQAGRKWTENETQRSAEIDVLLDRPENRGVLVIECKSKIPGSRVNLEEVQKWRDDRVPLLHRILRDNLRYSDKPLTFELWTNGPLGADVLSWLNSLPVPDDYTVGWKDGEGMKVYAAKAQSPSIRKILNEHYFRHPLARLV